MSVLNSSTVCPGESALHIAVVIGDCDLVQILVEAGANVNQRATGTFFLPEDQKKRYTGQTNYEGNLFETINCFHKHRVRQKTVFLFTYLFAVRRITSK